MQDNVFGDPIINGSRSQMSVNALERINADGKRDQAVAFVKNQLDQVNEARRLGTTMCIFYNATGLPLTNPFNVDYLGNVRPRYPVTVANGRWGAFLHEESENWPNTGSKAYVTYRVGAGDTNECIGLMGWKTPHNEPNNIHALCDVYEPRYEFDNALISTAIDQGRKKTKSTNSSNLVKFISMTASIASIGTAAAPCAAPLFEAIFENA